MPEARRSVRSGRPREVVGLPAVGKPWHGAAKCQGHHEHFHAPDDASESRSQRQRREERARQLCAACDVQSLCLVEALRLPDDGGVWGGLPSDTLRVARQWLSG